MSKFKISIMLLIGFWVLPTVSSSQAIAEQLKFAVISDIRANAIDAALEFISSQKADFIIVAGDFCYGSQEYYPHFTKYGFGVSERYDATEQRVYFAIGNHDSPPKGGRFFRNAIAPLYPDNGPADSPRGTVFSFDRGECHFVFTNQYWKYPEGGYTRAQQDWIAADLAKSDKRFKFVIGHEPAFPKSRHVGDSLDIDTQMRDNFWQILADGGVQAFFCGHSHHLSYIRHQGVYQLDAGQVRSGYRFVTMVAVDDEQATASTYELDEDDGFMKLFENESNTDNFLHQTVFPAKPGKSDSSPEILYEESGAGDAAEGCFIQHCYGEQAS